MIILAFIPHTNLRVTFLVNFMSLNIDHFVKHGMYMFRKCLPDIGCLW